MPQDKSFGLALVPFPIALLRSKKIVSLKLFDVPIGALYASPHWLQSSYPFVERKLDNAPVFIRKRKIK